MHILHQISLGSKDQTPKPSPNKIRKIPPIISSALSLYLPFLQCVIYKNNDKKRFSTQNQTATKRSLVHSNQNNIAPEQTILHPHRQGMLKHKPISLLMEGYGLLPRPPPPIGTITSPVQVPINASLKLEVTGFFGRGVIAPFHQLPCSAWTETDN